MQTLNININKAKIESFTVHLGDERPNVSATIQLMTDGGKKITSYSIMSNHWDDSAKFDLPPDVVGPIIKIGHILEGVVANHCQSSALRLTAPVVSDIPL